MGGIVSTVTRTFLQPFLAVVRFVSAASMEDTDTVEAPLEDCFYVENNYIFTPLYLPTYSLPSRLLGVTV